MVTVDSQKLKRIVYEIFAGNGLCMDDAKILADVLVETNLSGRASHGVLRVGIYLERFKRGGVKLRPNIRIIRETEISAVIDGDNGAGMLVAYKAAQLTRTKAKNAGMACIVVKNSNHFGAGAYWGEMIGQDDLISFNCCNTVPLMVPPGGKGAAVGTNPLCIYVPSESFGPVCLDIATSTVAQGKIFDYQSKHLSLGDGWAVDENGIPTNDADMAKYLVPFAAHKGFGFAVVADILSALLAGGQFGLGVNDMYKDVEKPNHISHCFMAIKIDQFRNLSEFRKEVDRYIEYLHNVPAIKGQHIYFPGEIEQINKMACLNNGIELPEDLVEELVGFANEVGIKNARNYFEI